jgi:hypothetical protein
MPTVDVPRYILRIHIAPGATSYANTAANAQEREVLREMSNALLKTGDPPRVSTVGDLRLVGT